MALFPLKKIESPIPKADRVYFFLALILASVMVYLDQLTKCWIVRDIPFGTRKPVINGFFDLTYITNTGAAWGILSGHEWFLLLISGAVFIAALWFIKTLVDGWKERYFAILLVLSGIIGNSADRIFRGAVVDFLSFYIGKYVWPSFNVADSCICVGIFIYILSSLLRPERPKTDPDSTVYVRYQK